MKLALLQSRWAAAAGGFLLAGGLFGGVSLHAAAQQACAPAKPMRRP